MFHHMTMQRLARPVPGRFLKPLRSMTHSGERERAVHSPRHAWSPVMGWMQRFTLNMTHWFLITDLKPDGQPDGRFDSVSDPRM